MARVFAHKRRSNWTRGIRLKRVLCFSVVPRSSACTYVIVANWDAQHHGPPCCAGGPTPRQILADPRASCISTQASGN